MGERVEDMGDSLDNMGIVYTMAVVGISNPPGCKPGPPSPTIAPGCRSHSSTPAQLLQRDAGQPPASIQWPGGVIRDAAPGGVHLDAGDVAGGGRPCAAGRGGRAQLWGRARPAGE